MSRSQEWAEETARRFRLFLEDMHNRGVSIGEVAHIANSLDEDEPWDEGDLENRVVGELLM